ARYAAGSSDPPGIAVVAGGNDGGDVRTAQAVDDRLERGEARIARRREDAPAQAQVGRGDVVGRAQRINVIETLDDVAVEGRNAAAAGIAEFVKHLDGNDPSIRRNATGAGQNAGAPGGDAGHMRAVPAREVIVRARRTRARTGALRRPAGAVR